MSNIDGALVYVIDDDAEVRGALDSLLRSTGYEVQLFDSPQAFTASAKPDMPSCLVLDVRLRAESGLDFQSALIARGMSIPVILITGHGDIPMTVRAMKSGAVDFLPKPFREEDILSAVAAAIRRDRAGRAEAAEIADLVGRYATLTEREREVIGLVTAGLMNKQIAAQMDLSEVTVKIHRGNATRKMAAQSLADLVRMAEALGVRDQSVSRFRASA